MARASALLLHAGLVAGVAAAIPAGGAAAQEPVPLHKSELVRLLTGGTYSEAEVTAIVRRACLRFRPTPRDLDDFRSLGADEPVMEAIRSCTEEEPPPGGAAEEGAVTAPPAPPPPAPPPTGAAARAPAREAGPEQLTLFLSPRRLTLGPTDSAEVTAEVTAGAAPAPGVRLELWGAGPGGTLRGTAVTDGAGRARLPVTGEDVGWALELRAPGRVLVGEAAVRVEARPAVDGEEPAPAARRPDVAEDAGAGREAGGRDLEAGDLARAVRRADSLSRAGRYAPAMVLYEALLAEWPGDADVLAGMGLHLLRTGQHGRAAEVLERARRVDPARPAVQRALGFLALWGERPEEAVAWFRAATEAAPRDVEAWWGLARALEAAGRSEEARRAAAEARALEAEVRPGS